MHGRSFLSGSQSELGSLAGGGECGHSSQAVDPVLRGQVLYTVSRTVHLAGRPYIPGFLSFREDALAELVLDVLAKPEGRAVPQVLFVDGNGRLHPRQAGSAVAIGVKTGLPTIGVAKEYFPVHSARPDQPSTTAEPTCDYLATRQSLRVATRTLLRRRGDWVGLRDAASPTTPPTSADEYLGAALRSSPHAQGSNPVYVSCGHRVGLATALELVLACCQEARVPEPVRQADLIGQFSVCAGVRVGRVTDMIDCMRQGGPRLSGSGADGRRGGGEFDSPGGLTLACEPSDWPGPRSEAIGVRVGHQPRARRGYPALDSNAQPWLVLVTTHHHTLTARWFAATTEAALRQ